MFNKLYKEYWADLDDDYKFPVSIFLTLFACGGILLVYLLVKYFLLQT